jgi:hypothetical protein
MSLRIIPIAPLPTAILLLAGFALQMPASVTYQTASDWGSAFNGQFNIVNDTGAAITNWSLTFDFAPSIGSMWNGVVVTHTGNHYVVGPASWNAAIPVGGTVQVGFGGAPGNVTVPPQNMNFTFTSPAPPAPPATPPPTTPPPTTPPPSTPPPVSTGISVNVVQTGQWNGGFGANLVITNTGTAPVNNWTLNMNFTPAVTSLWNGNYTQTGSALSVTNLSWNGSIPAGTSQTIGLNGNGLLSANSSSNCMFNGLPCTLSYSVQVNAPVTPQSIVISTVDNGSPAYWFTIPQGTNTYALSLQNGGNANFSVVASNSNVTASIVGSNTLQVTGVAPGRASLKLVDSVTGSTRFVGVRVKNSDGTLPGMPSYVSLGSVSQDTTPDLSFWQSFQPGGQNKRVDVRYIYLNGGPYIGWDTWGNNPGDRATTYIRNSHMLGMIPYFVYYNIPDGGESYTTDTSHISDPAYMAAYFTQLKLALNIINQESPDDIVGMLLEPDFLGYLAQNAGAPASQIAAMTHAAYTSGVLTAGVDPAFPDTVAGLVQAINYTIHKNCPQVFFGWQMNLWASPAGGWTTPVPGKGIVHLTEANGIAKGRQLIATEAAAIVNYYVSAGVLTNGAKFVSIDKYGLDATGFEASAQNDPADSYWFWNNDLWGNYLTFVNTMHTTTGLPVILWQLPVGHINNSQLADPYTGGLFPTLIDSNCQLEDSAPDFFLGDTFQTSGARFTYFSANLAADPKVTTNGGNTTWGSHMSDAAAAGVISVLFGAGVGASTQGTGAPPTDSYWWITAAQGYYSSVVPHK